MKKVTGIKSIDFKIKALGHGVVNWNGPTSLTGDGGKTVDNHTLPKLRGYTNLTGKVKEETGYKYRKEATDIDFKKTPLYISQNCIRHHLFRDQAFDVHYANKSKTDDLTNMLASITGLVRGYVVPSSQNKRTSPLLIEDFVDQLGNGNFEQFGQAGERDKSSFFSKTTFGDTQYISYGSISIEQLQFISLDKKFDREAMGIKAGQGSGIAQSVQDFIQSLNSNLKPVATFHENYVRSGTIFEEGEVGILLNQDAIQALVEYTIEIISELSIRQAKSYMYVDEVLVDYNDSNKMMRIKRDETNIAVTPENEFATYFYQK
ncbi:type I-Fv CRISPR-associated protein Cas7fv [Pseudocolwellia sp. AS88]|uniref:type I-Fv CRISPR-associated protein Cas7fv n=1 Tax=Pseudocolwellia sp. AS88 TaxID=3063958 RepID=UPI0026ED923C|nr:type I-Fv CRISPR-associated protein Cas7fv [Pseudocolwellia sp. AS88]MDO7086782.1 type I-Fv CRISPR-associated protein Cas7fv [Pseudocolwellia sp. AS88]